MSRATSFARSWLLAAALSGSAPFLATGQTADVPPRLENRVLVRVAEVWGVAQETLHLQWGRLTLEHPLEESVSVRLIGNGSDGWFAVSFLREDGSSVATRVRVGVEDTILVAARPLDSGSELTLGDIQREVRMSWRRPRATRNAEPDVGWIVRRPIATGQVLSSPAVSQPKVITAGESVQFTWSRGAVRISMTGVALNAARLGERVRARISGRSTTHVDGIATGPGTAKLKGSEA